MPARIPVPKSQTTATDQFEPYLASKPEDDKDSGDYKHHVLGQLALEVEAAHHLSTSLSTEI